MLIFSESSIRNNLFIIASVFGSLLVSTNSYAAFYKTAIQCDNGEAKLEVDLAERRNFKLTLSNPRVSNYLAEKVMGYYPQVSELFANGSYTGSYRDGNMIINGQSPEGLFRSSDFSYFRYGQHIDSYGVVDCQPYSGGCGDGGRRLTFYVKRGESDSLVIEAWRPRHYSRYCIRRDNYSGQCLEYNPTQGWEKKFIADWTFRGCQQIDLPN
jgi:hypothetical protein